MLKRAFISTVRHLIRYKTFSLINVIGLALSMTALGFIALYVVDELSYDRHHAHADRIYRVVSHGRWDGGAFDITGTSGPTAGLLAAFPEVAQTVRLDAEGGGIITYNQKKIREDRILFADSGFFDVFSHRFLKGNPHQALSNPNSIVLTETLASTLFGDIDNAMGKTIYFDANDPNLVTGIIEDVPTNSHFTFAALRSFPENFAPDIANFFLYTYVLLKPHTDVSELQAKLPALVTKHFQATNGEINYSLELQPLPSIHLHSHLSYELGENRSIYYVYALSLIGLLILAAALINYVNITMARASVRLRDIAIRKVIGSTRKDLIQLFLTEAMLLTLTASFVSMLVMMNTLPYFNMLTGKALEWQQFSPWFILGSLILFPLFTALVGGLYPAMWLSSFKTIPSLKNQLGTFRGKDLFQKSLVIFQFTVTVVLIAISMLIYRQLDYVSTKDLGFNKNQVFSFHLDNLQIREKVPAFKDAILTHPAIQAVAAAGNPIGNNNIGMLDYNPWVNGAIDQHSHLGFGLSIDEDFISALQIKLVEGRNFSTAMASDSSRSIIVNEALVRKAGWDHGVGQRIQLGPGQPKTVVGVVRDFHIYSLQHQIEPMILSLPVPPREKDNLYVRIDPSHRKEALEHVEATLSEFDQGALFDYRFLDQNFALQYAAVEKQGAVLFAFTLLAVIIACLGIYALILFSAERRTKEIGIRKVLGASLSAVVTLLSKDLVKLVIVAILIAAPVAWWIMNDWLEGFAYRVETTWWMIAVPGIAATAIAMATLSIQAIKAATANPVESLRNE